jgi:hypothetical protein
VPRPAAPVVAAALGLVALAASIGVIGARHDTHPLGTNGVRALLFAADVPPGRTVCQSGETVPEKAAGVWLRAGTYGAPTPRLSVSIDAPGAPPMRGRLAPGWREGDIVVPVPAASAERTDARLCVTNGGPGKLALAGEALGPVLNARVGKTAQAGRVRAEYRPATAESWWALVPDLIRRVDVVREAPPGIAALPLFGLLAVLIAGGAVALVLRVGRE